MKINKKENTCCSSKSCCSGERQPGRKPAAPFQKVSTRLTPADKWGAIRVRLGIKRMSYQVEPGVYAVGNPGPESVVLVTSNYKLSFDSLRKELSNLDAWILVLDTKGINVWCAAGKGTFSTDELVRRIEVTQIAQLVNHRRLIIPQLGAVGISAHQVKERSGFKVIYGPVRACDLPAFLEAGMKASPEMRRVHFNFYDRLKVIPVEVSMSLKYLFFSALAFFFLSGLSSSGYSLRLADGWMQAFNIAAAFIAGTVIGPLLLPWLPGRSFSVKGLWAGIIGFLIIYFADLVGAHPLHVVSWGFITTAIASFLTMNFTGASTYTSLSGVKKEMRVAVPLQIASAVIGVGLWIGARFV